MATSLILSVLLVIGLSIMLYQQRRKFHLLSLQIAQVINQSRGVEAIPSLDIAPWIESCQKETCEVWSRSFFIAAYSNLAKFLPSVSVMFALESASKEEVFPDFIPGNIDPVLELILRELLSDDRKAMRKAAIQLERFGIYDHRTQIFEVISGIGLAVWIGSNRILATDTWDQIVRYLAEVQRLFAILVLKRRAKESSVRKDSQLMLQQVSHDIRSPLHNMKNALILMNEDDKEDISEYINVALNNLESISELTESILDYSTVSAGVIESKLEDIVLKPFLEDIVARYKISASVKGLVLELKLKTFSDKNHNENLSVSFDRRHLDRIISNLISNAVKYSSEGVICLSIEVINQDIVSIIVSDQGIGLTAEQQEKLFTPFTRFQRHAAPGAGLGLSFARQLAELNGAKLCVKSTFGKGSSFVLEGRRAYPKPVVMDDSDNVSLPAVTAPVKVLLIEDDPDFCDSVTRSLKFEGIIVLSSQNFVEAQSILQFENVDCIISDLEAGQGSLQELAAYISSTMKNIPILVVSGNTLNAIPKGVHSMVRKPIHYDYLVDWIKNTVVAKENKSNNLEGLAA